MLRGEVDKKAELLKDSNPRPLDYAPPVRHNSCPLLPFYCYTWLITLKCDVWAPHQALDGFSPGLPGGAARTGRTSPLHRDSPASWAAPHAADPEAAPVGRYKTV